MARSTAEYQRKQRKLKPRQYREYDLKRNFGIDLAIYQRMFVEQGGVCAICKQAETSTWRDKVRWLAVDHDHSTGAVRGLLCAECNIGIGKFKDAPEMLRRAIAYLERHLSKVVPLKKVEN